MAATAAASSSGLIGIRRVYRLGRHVQEETDAEVAEIQRLLDTHLARANPHMTAIITPERRLTARQVATYLQGTRHVAFASVNGKGEPRVSPLDALFIHGRFTLSTGSTATKLRHLRRNPACSAVHMDGDRVAIAVDGVVEWIGTRSSRPPDRSTGHGPSSTGPTHLVGRRDRLLPDRAALHVGLCLPPRGVPGGRPAQPSRSP